MTQYLLVPVLLLLFVPVAVAGDIHVPSNTPTSGVCNNFPFNPNWSGASGSFRYQLLVPSSLLGGKACCITQVSFAPCYTVTFKATQFEMSMGHTTLATPSLTFVNNMPAPQVVFPAGPVSYARTASTWSPLNLAQAFVYNGIDNLVVEIRYQGGTLQGGSSSADRQNSILTLNYHRLWRYGTGSYTNPTASGTDARGLLMRLTYQDVYIIGSGTTNIGGTMNLILRAPGDGGLPYQVGTSLGAGPIPIGSRNLGLSLDDLLVVTVRGYLPAIFQRYTGYMPASGQGFAVIAIPSATALIGVRLHSAFLTLKSGEPFNIKSISNTYSFTITK